jgi:hypothetical protein
MFMDIDQAPIRQQELVHEARKRHLQRRLRANRKQSLGTRPQADSSPTATGVIETKQLRAAFMKLQPGNERPAWSMNALALRLLGQRRSSYGKTPR